MTAYKIYSWQRYIVLSALVINIIVAFNSVGYHHEDEHFQLVEFANFKLHLNTAQELAWEYQAQIRPGLQPLICYLIIRFCYLLGLVDNAIIAFILRGISAVLSVLVIRYFIQTHKSIIIPRLHLPFYLVSYFLWFLPYINVRFSSENYSALMMLFALALFQRHKKKLTSRNIITIGCTLGFSILFRFQSSIFVLSFALWLIFIWKISFKSIVLFCSAVLATLSLGIIIDFWLYHDFTISIINYFRVNIINNIASKFGTSPWFYYLKAVSLTLGPIGIISYASLLYAILFRPKWLILWLIFPFFLIHSIIPHKELRFLFPLANLIPLLLFLVAQSIYKNWSLEGVSKNINIIKITCIILILLPNILGLIAVATVSAGNRRAVLAQYIRAHYSVGKTNVLVVGDARPFVDFTKPINRFYNSSGFRVQDISSIWQDDLFTYYKYGLKNILVIKNEDITGPRAIEFMENRKMRKVYQNVPTALILFFKYYSPVLLEDVISIYELE